MPVYAEYQPHSRWTPDHLSDVVPWRSIIAPGVVLQKDRHGLQRTYAIRGPDSRTRNVRGRIIAQTHGYLAAPVPLGRIFSPQIIQVLLEVFSPMQIIFVVKNRFHASNFTFKSSITRVTSSLARTRCPKWNHPPLRRGGGGSTTVGAHPK